MKERKKSRERKERRERRKRGKDGREGKEGDEGRERKLFSVSDVGIVALAGSCTCVANPDMGGSHLVRKVTWITIDYKLAFTICRNKKV